jgi:UDP-glucose 4-epimerase
MLLSSTSETYASTTDVLNWKVPTAEDVPLSVADVSNPRWSYASGKIAAESALLGAHHQSNFPVTIIRYHNVYGPRMGNQHVIPQFLGRAMRGVFSLYGADNKRCFIYVQDAVRATRFLAEHNDSLGQIFHVGTNEEVSMKELASEIMTILGVRSDVEILPAPEGSVSRRVPDVSRMASLMGSQETVQRKIGLTRTIDYYLEEFNRTSH